MANDAFDLDCDEKCFTSAPLSRRTFGAASVAAASLAGLKAATAQGMDVTETEIDIETPDGTSDTVFFHPSEGKHPGVLMWTDIMGLRPVFYEMGRRLASQGYSVLVPNPFYRDGRAPLPGPDFNFSTDRPIAMKLMGNLVAPGAAERDAETYVAWLDAQDQVDSSSKMGTTGYCMGGPLTMRTAGLLPDRIGAAGSFHGGGLATDRDDSPHLLIPKMKVHYHIGVADNDDEREPEVKNILRAAFDGANVTATIKVYEDADHGWCVPTSSVYNEAQAEVAWTTLLDTFKAGLA
ncbi:MAG: dienelactone hydrolase family protein [Rhodospirillaceae bacterium]